MNIPDKFTFFNQNRTLKLTNINGDFYCTLPEVDADTISSAVYDRLNVEHKLHTGQWKIVADLTLAEKGPEMKFPFTFKCQGYESLAYTALGIENGRVLYTWDNHNGEPGDIYVDQAKEAIKNGYWLVQSVGEQAPSKLDTFNDNKVENFKESTRLSGIVDCGYTGTEIKVGSLSAISAPLADQLTPSSLLELLAVAKEIAEELKLARKERQAQVANVVRIMDGAITAKNITVDKPFDERIEDYLKRIRGE